MNKKAFTLIELLAVILVLGVISLIAIPTVNNILKNSKKTAYKTTISNLTVAIQNNCLLEKTKDKKVTDLYVLVNGKIEPNVDIHGILNNTTGRIYVDENSCNVEFSNLHNDDYSVKKTLSDYEIIIGDLNYEIELIDLNKFENWRIGCYQYDTGVFSESSLTRISLYDYLTIAPNTKYKPVYTGRCEILIRLMDKNKKIIQNVGVVQNGQEFTTTPDTVYVAVSLYNRENDANNVKINYEYYKDYFTKNTFFIKRV